MTPPRYLRPITLGIFGEFTPKYVNSFCKNLYSAERGVSKRPSRTEKTEKRKSPGKSSGQLASNLTILKQGDFRKTTHSSCLFFEDILSYFNRYSRFHVLEPHMSAEVIDLTAVSDSDDSEYHTDEETSDEGGEVSDPTVRLLTAVGHVPEARLRQILIKVIQEDPSFERALWKEFFVEKKRTREVVERWEVCANCKEEYDASEDRGDEECAFHPGTSVTSKFEPTVSDSGLGELEVDEDEFPDHDERVHGPMDTEENKRNNPLGFTWSCCGAIGVYAPECESGQHIPSAKKAKK